MSAATQARNTPRREAFRVGHPTNPGTQIHSGTLIALLATNGNAVPAGTAGSGDAVGVALRSVTGTSAGEPVECERGTGFRFDNSAGADAIARADIGATAYIVDDQTVSKTDNSGARKRAGVVLDVDAAGVWIVVG
ncbi:hypothetical protein [Stenotrophomonas sp. C-A]|nr:hypothetical protein [Stenotrophomonas maltophilia]